MDTNKTERYIDSLESLLDGYSNSNHLSIGLPANVDWNNKIHSSTNKTKLQKYYDIFTKTQPRFKIEDLVPIKLLPKLFVK